MIYEPKLLIKALDEISAIDDNYFMPERSNDDSSASRSNTFAFFWFQENEKFREHVASMTRREVTDVLLALPEITGKAPDERILLFLKQRYRRYVFRIVYLIWQDNYDRPGIRDILLYILDHPKTAYYIEETGFSAAELKAIAISDNMETRIAGMARNQGVSVREFLSGHRISLTSYLAVDVMSVFLLFCSGEDCLALGSDKLIRAMSRFDILNQAKVINNLYTKLQSNVGKELPELVKYIVDKHGLPDINAPDRNDFWSLVHLQVIRSVADDYNEISN